MNKPPITLLRRILDTADQGCFYSHVSSDVDSLLSLVIIYWTLRDCRTKITIEEFANNRVILTPADYDVEYPNFGIDIGIGIGPNNVKRSEIPITIDGNNISPVCSSLYLAYNLLPRRQFDAMRPLLMQVNEVDTRGITNFNYSISNSEDESTPITVNLWSIIGVLQQNNSLLNTLMVAENIFTSYLNTAILEMDSLSTNLNMTRIIECSNGYRIAVPPVNSGRLVGMRCFRVLRANAVIFSTFNPVNSTATLGVSVSKAISFSGNASLQIIVKYPELAEFSSRHNLYTSPHVVGRTDKSPFIVDTEHLDTYREGIVNAMIKFFEFDFIKKNIIDKVIDDAED